MFKYIFIYSVNEVEILLKQSSFMKVKNIVTQQSNKRNNQNSKSKSQDYNMK